MFFAGIEVRLQELHRGDSIFGRIAVLVAGDFAQLALNSNSFFGACLSRELINTELSELMQLNIDRLTEKDFERAIFSSKPVSDDVRTKRGVELFDLYTALTVSAALVA